MASPRFGIFLAAACCALACGDRPDPPGPAVANADGPNGEGSASGSLDRPNDDEAEPDDDASSSDPPEDAPASGASDAGLAPAVPDDDDDAPPIPSRQSASACTDDGGDCLIMNIAVSDVSADSCIQLVLDNCERAPQAGLRVRLPVSWRLGSASVTSEADDCVPGAQFNPQNGSTIIDASGTISWNLTTRVPSEIVLDVTLEPASSALDPIRLTNSDLVDSLIECD